MGSVDLYVRESDCLGAIIVYVAVTLFVVAVISLMILCLVTMMITMMVKLLCI